MFALKCIQVEGENELFEVNILKYNLSLFPEVVAARAGFISRKLSSKHRGEYLMSCLDGFYWISFPVFFGTYKRIRGDIAPLPFVVFCLFSCKRLSDARCWKINYVHHLENFSNSE